MSALRDRWWFRLTIRAVLLALAIAALSFSRDRFAEFQEQLTNAFTYNLNLLGRYGFALLMAGFFFGLAVWFPFTSFRYLPSRLIVAAIALIPFVQTFVLAQRLMAAHHVSSWWLRPRWFSETLVISEATVLAGVALASGFRTKPPPTTQSMGVPPMQGEDSEVVNRV